MNVKARIGLLTLAFLVGIGGSSALMADEENAAALKPQRSTRLYVRTTPSGAHIKLDGKPNGTSDHLFKVPPGVKKMVVEVELDGHYPKQQEVIIRGGRITRVELVLEAQPAESVEPAVAQSKLPVEVPDYAIRVSHTGDRSEDKRSLGGSGHAIAFDRPDGGSYVVAVQIFASRYGLPEPPNEDFHIYLLDQDWKVIRDLTYPYSMVERTSKMRWYTLAVPGVEVTQQFHVATSFNPHATKGIYLGIDKNVKETHSYVGLPDQGYEQVTDLYDWMVRAYLVPNPFAE